MADTALDSLIVNLIGDGSSYQKMLADAQRTTQQVAKQVEQATATIEKMGAGLQSFAGNVGKALAALGLGAWLSGARQSFADAQRTQVQLGIAIEASGRSAEEVLPKYAAFAAATAAATTTSQQEIFHLLKLAESRGLTGDAATTAAQRALALASALDTSTDAGLRSAVALAQGNTQLLRRQLRMSRAATDAEVVARIQQVLNTGWRQATAVAETASGRMEQLGNSFRTLRNEIGGLISEALMPVIAAVQRAVDWFNALDPATRRSIEAVAAIAAGFVVLGPAVRVLGPLVGMIAGPIRGMAGLLARIPSLWTAIGASILLVSGPVGFVFRSVRNLSSTVHMLAAAFGLVGPTLRGLAAVLGFVFSPVTLAITAATIAVAMFVESAGGIGPAWQQAKDFAVGVWDAIQTRVAEFLAWIKPITQAVVSFWNAAWPLIKQGARDLYDYVSEKFTALGDWIDGVWEATGLKGVVTWNSVRDAIRDSILFGEYTMTHFGQVIEYVWAGAKLGVIAFGGEVGYIFTRVIPAVFNWFTENFRDIFTTSINFVTRLIANFASNVVDLIKAIPRLVKNEVTFSEIWHPLTEGFVNTIKKLPNIPERVTSELEDRLRAEYEQLGGALDQDFGAFRAEKLKEFGEQVGNLVPPAAAAKVKTGIGAVNTEVETLSKATKTAKLNVASFFSAEALSRIQEYQDTLAGGEKPKGATPQAAAAAGSAEALTRSTDYNTSILKDINQNIEKQTAIVEKQTPAPATVNVPPLPKPATPTAPVVNMPQTPLPATPTPTPVPPTGPVPAFEIKAVVAQVGAGSLLADAFTKAIQTATGAGAYPAKLPPAPSALKTPALETQAVAGLFAATPLLTDAFSKAMQLAIPAGAYPEKIVSPAPVVNVPATPIAPAAPAPVVNVPATAPPVVNVPATPTPPVVAPAPVVNVPATPAAAPLVNVPPSPATPADIGPAIGAFVAGLHSFDAVLGSLVARMAAELPAVISTPPLPTMPPAPPAPALPPLPPVESVPVGTYGLPPRLPAVEAVPAGTYGVPPAPTLPPGPTLPPLVDLLPDFAKALAAVTLTVQPAPQTAPVVNVAAAEPRPVTPAAAPATPDMTAMLLREILDVLRADAQKPRVEIAPAGLA